MNPSQKKIQSLKNEVSELQTVLNNTDAYIFTKDTQGRYTFVNQKVCDLFGKSYDEIVGKTDHHFFDLDKSNDLLKVDKKVLKGKRIETTETNIIKKTGEVKIYKSNKVPLFDEDGKVSGLCGISTNITEQQKLQEEQAKAKEIIKNQKANLSSLIENTSDYIWSVDKNYKLLTANSAFLDLIENLIKKRLSIGSKLLDKNLYSKKQYNFIKSLSDKALNGEKFNKVIKTLNNRIVELSFNPIIEKGTPIGFTVFGTDITKFKEVEAKLLRNQLMYSRTQKIGKMGSWELDILTNKLIWSEEIYHIFNVPEIKDLSFEKFLELVHPDDREALNKKWINALKKIEPYEIEHRIIAGGKIKWLKEKAEISFNSEGKAVYAIGFVQDITKRKLMQEKAKENENKYKNIINHSPNIHFQTDLNQKLTFISRSFNKITGKRPKEVIGKKISEIFKTSKEEKHFIDLLKADKKVKNYVVSMKHKNGGLLYLSTNFHCFKDADGNILGVEGVAQDITKDVLSKAALEKSQTRLNTIFKEAPHGIALVDSITGEFYDINPQYLKIVGRTKKELITLDWMKITHPEDLQEDLDNMARLNSGAIKKYQMNKRLMKSEGNYVWVNLTVASIINNQNSSPMHLAMIEDISRRKESEIRQKKEAKQKQKQKEAIIKLYHERDDKDYEKNWRNLTEILSSTLEVSRASVWVLSDDKKELHCLNLYDGINKKHTKDHVLKADELSNYFNALFKNTQIIADDAQNNPKTKELCESYLKPLDIKSMIDIGIISDGEISGVLCCENIGEKRKWTSNEIAFISNIGSISSQYLTQSALKESEETFKKLFFDSSNATVLADINGVIRKCNEAALKMLKLKEEELLNQSPYHISPEFQSDGISSFEKMKEYIGIAVRKGIHRFNWDIITSTNEQLVVDTTLMPIVIEGKRMLHASLRDITLVEKYKNELERKVEERTKELFEALEKEKELNELKSRFVSMASHEFRTPLTSISLATGTIKEFWNKLKPQDRNKKLVRIEEQIDHMTRMLDDVLVVGKADAGKIKCAPQRINFMDFISPIMEEVYNTTGKTHEIVLTNKLTHDFIFIDKKLGRNIFINLLTNAIKFSPESNQVLIKATTINEQIKVQITDFGIGIKESELESIFMPFERGINAELIQGTGLGLAIVKEAIKLHNGKITCKSTLGESTTFTFTLPNPIIFNET